MRLELAICDKEMRKWVILEIHETSRQSCQKVNRLDSIVNSERADHCL
jgi:hypothetical protein